MTTTNKKVITNKEQVTDPSDHENFSELITFKDHQKEVELNDLEQFIN